ncbi:unnamed protein product [Malassezia sympodialis ATCC 42132]|uniref:uncharacterized protein n=1 Tax=Malassezia sympodialis (strain ATCC 42132) TaxID=1230383 RepID=UPI0002C25E84|nr:uncharacterized protein MSY001_2829 [Malassezia sympodialis ATCC 42132]CCV00124.1 unnamed protein product [Malassezia sympodialis ATCC 42132]|eukprot:XP_018741333.1 uncharacterized protein MSY001_2829 [Malassezia sympodialis ATCC 42132]
MSLDKGAQAAKEETNASSKREAEDSPALDEDGDETSEEDLEQDGDEEDDDEEDGDEKVLDGKSRKTMKQLLGVGETQLSDEQPETRDGILSLAPGIRKTANASTMRAKAARMMLEQRRQREERAHVKDVIGEWGPPGVQASSGPVYTEAMDAWLEQGGTKGYERRLRKTAQRGEDDIDKARSMQTTKQARKVNALGNKEMAVKQLSKSHFLELLRQSPKTTHTEPNP